METCIVYCRKSDPNAKDGDPSFEDQESACRAYAAQQGYTVLRAVREAHTGMDLLKRSGIWDAMDDIAHGRASVLVAYSYDRLARKPEHQGSSCMKSRKSVGDALNAQRNASTVQTAWRALAVR